MISCRGLSPNAAYWRLLRMATQNALPQVPSRLGNYVDLGHVFVELDQGERLCFLDGRCVNPVFALVETAWLLMGRNDLAPLQSVLANYERYSDDGDKLNGAYGFRLRAHFGIDQIKAGIQELRRYPTSRRTVLSLYAASDIGKKSEDIPCNTQVIFRIEEGRLAMTVINRSNDLWLGVPYNWFAFRGLQQLMATELGMNPGHQRHVSTCLHLYEKDIEAARRVVASNTLSSIGHIDETAASLNLAAFLADLQPLSGADFGAVKSPELVGFLQRYQDFRNAPGIRAMKASEVVPRRTIDIVLDRWIAARRQTTETIVTATSLCSNPDSPIYLALQKWVFSDACEGADMLAGLKAAAEKVRPLLPAFISKGLPVGVHATLDESEVAVVSLHVTLELILGSLDPELHQVPIGVRLIKRLREIATQAGLPEQPIIGREVSESVLKEIFGHLPLNFESYLERSQC